MGDVVRPVVDVDLDSLAGPEAAAALAGLRSRSPVAWVPALDGWLVTSHALALRVMRDAVACTVDDPRFTTARVVGASMLSTDGAAHRRHRQPFAAPFRRRELEQRFGPQVDHLAGELVGRLRPRGTADLRRELAGPLSVGVVAHALGLADVDATTVLGWYAAIVAAVTALSAGEPTTGAETDAVGALDAAVRSAMARGTAPLLEHARGTLGEEEIVSNAAVMMFGGIETTEAMIANLFVHLLGDPTLLDRVRADGELVPSAVEESLRLEPAAAVVDRYATADLVLGGVEIRAGELVRVSLAAANRDPAVFADPDAFLLDRPGVGAHLAFARGPHACIAMDLARLEAVAALRAVLEQFPGLCASGEQPAVGLVFRKPPAVNVRWEV